MLKAIVITLIAILFTTNFHHPIITDEVNIPKSPEIVSKLELSQFKPLETFELLKPVPQVRPQIIQIVPQVISAQNNGNCMLMTEQLAKYLVGEELQAAVKLGQLESGCRSQIANSSSGACNYFQELPCGKWGGTTNVDAHIQGAISYCRARYGNFQNALAIWYSRSPHWW